MEWDVLFLIPWPWLGPWIAPALVALLLVVWGGWIYNTHEEPRLPRFPFSLFVTGAALTLIAFLQPAFPVLMEGEKAIRGYQPGTFSWWLFGAAYLVMAVGLWRVSITTGVANGGAVDDE